MEQAITAVGKDGFVGVYAANDGTGGGAIAAMKGNGIDPKTRPTTGQDAELAAIQRIAAGEQEMTIYKPIKIEAETAAEVAVDIANGESVDAPDEYNGQASFIFDPIVVTQDNIMDTVVADGFYSVEDICTDDYADACASAGIE
jgi:D-xylose transport system substrate-binding protein